MQQAQQQSTQATISTHAPRTGSDCKTSASRCPSAISTHAPRTGSDHLPGVCEAACGISTHAPRTGSDTIRARGICIRRRGNFNPRSPHGERRIERRFFGCVGKFQPTLPARGATWTDFLDDACIVEFQPTLPARGATPCCGCPWTSGTYFNPRSPHGERRCNPSDKVHTLRNFNPRSPHGERLLRIRFMCLEGGISTHAPRTGSDCPDCGKVVTRPTFQPTLPARGATCCKTQTAIQGVFQPTLPARGATFWRRIKKSAISYFNPRSPHGERPASQAAQNQYLVFQPTLPARGATDALTAQRIEAKISTHAPRTGSDMALRMRYAPCSHFNPRSPHGERPSCLCRMSR